MLNRSRDISDLLGIDEDDDDDVVSFKNDEVYKIAGGVSVQWLARAFQMTRHHADKRLRGLAPIGSGKHNNPLYDFVEAATRLVDPDVDLEKYIAGLKPSQFPEKLRESYWNSMLKRQRWEEKAGHLWRTEVVLERYSELLLEIRTVLQLLPESIERKAGLSSEQHKVARAIIDDLQKKMHETILAFAEKSVTPSQLGELESQAEDDEDEDFL